MDLDDTETEGVVFVAQAVTGNGLSADSETASLTCHPTSAPTPHLVLFPQDNNQVVDNMETRDTDFASQADTEGEDGTDSETASPTRCSTPVPHLASPQDDKQIMDLDDTETGGVFFVAQTDTGGSTDSEIVSLICHPTPALASSFFRMTTRLRTSTIERLGTWFLCRRWTRETKTRAALRR